MSNSYLSGRGGGVVPCIRGVCNYVWVCQIGCMVIFMKSYFNITTHRVNEVLRINMESACQ